MQGFHYGTVQTLYFDVLPLPSLTWFLCFLVYFSTCKRNLKVPLHVSSNDFFELIFMCCIFNCDDLLGIWKMNKKALTAALSLACMEIRSRNEEAINSTRNKIYSLKNWFSTRVSNDQKYLCNCRLYVCINTRKLKGLDSRKIRSLPEIKKVIDMAHHFIACSSHDPFTYNVYNTPPSQSC